MEGCLTQLFRLANGRIYQTIRDNTTCAMVKEVYMASSGTANVVCLAPRIPASAILEKCSPQADQPNQGIT
jgi:hypothetical protein